MKANTKNDLYFYELIKDGALTITEDGTIINNESGKTTVYRGRKNSYRRFHFNGVGIQAHRLVWIYFNGLIPNDIQINHKDGRKSNNELGNLELVTNSENTQHAFDTGLNKMSQEGIRCRSIKNSGSGNGESKLTDNQVIHCRKRFNNKNVDVNGLIMELSISRRAVENMLLGRSYSYLPFKAHQLSNSKDKYEEAVEAYTSSELSQSEVSRRFGIPRSTLRTYLKNRK